MNQEQAKYIATFFNNLSVGVIIFGAITPVLNNEEFGLTTSLVVLTSLISGIMLLIVGSIILKDIINGSKQ